MLRFARNDSEFWAAQLRKTTIDDLYRRPGFMIRRAHQISVALFLEETGALGITNRQYGILFALKHRPGIDQISVARLLGLDRSTTGMVIKKLADAGLIGRAVGAGDRRRASLVLTRAGERMLERLAEPAQRAQARVLSAFTPAERTRFLALLEKFVGTFNDSTRVRLEERGGRGKKVLTSRPVILRRERSEPRRMIGRRARQVRL